MLDAVVTYLRNNINHALESPEVMFLDAAQANPIEFQLNAVTMMVLNIEQELSMRQGRGFGRPGAQEDGPQSVRLNLSVLFVARYRDYTAGMGALSKILLHFQRNPIFDHANDPLLDARLGKLPVRLLPLSMAEQNEIWSTLRTPSLPCLMYRVTATFPDDALEAHPQAPISPV